MLGESDDLEPGEALGSAPGCVHRCRIGLHISPAIEVLRSYAGRMTLHQYRTTLAWEGSTRAGYRAYRRAHDVLAPRIAVRGAAAERVVELLHEAHAGCYIANSLTAETSLAPIVEVRS